MMMRAMRMALLMMMLLGAVITLSACRYQATDQDKTAVEEIISGFKSGIERYDTTYMTRDLADAFVLTLKEGTLEHTKTLAVLLEELDAEETNQLYWRETYGYRLELALTGGTPSFNDRFATAHSGFTVTESANGINPIVTDTGTIDWQFVRMGENYWRVTAMTITFDTVTSNAAAASAGSLPGSPFFRKGSR